MTETKNIYQKLAAIYQELDPIQKTGVNKDQNYKYIEQSMVVAEIRKLLAGHGVLLLTNVLSCEEQPNPGGKGTKAVLVMSFKLVNADKPEEFIEFPYWPSSAVDYSDKGINKATTMGQKYFLIRQFLISDADPDAETPVTDTTEKKTYQKRQDVDTKTGEVKGPAGAPDTSQMVTKVRSLAQGRRISEEALQRRCQELYKSNLEALGVDALTDLIERLGAAPVGAGK